MSRLMDVLEVGTGLRGQCVWAHPVHLQRVPMCNKTKNCLRPSSVF